MNKKILITPLVCMSLLATPYMHAWQVPYHLDAKRIGIIAAVTAAVLVGIAWYKHTKKVRGPGEEEVVIRLPKAELEQAVGTIEKLMADVKAQGAELQKLREKPGHEKELEAVKKQMAELQQALHAHQEMAKQVREDSPGLAAVSQQVASRDEGMGLIMRRCLHIEEEYGRMRAAVAEMAQRMNVQLGQAAVEGIFQYLAVKQEELQAQVQALEELRGEVAFATTQAGQALETLGKNEQEFASHEELLERHKNFIGQWALEVSAVKRKLAALPTKEDLEQFRKEQDIARRILQRFVSAAVAQMTSPRPVRLRIESHPEATQVALALNQEAVDPALTDTAEKIALQKAKQEEELKQLMEEVAKFKKKNKKAKKRAEAPAPTLPDREPHTPSEFVAPVLSPEAPSPFAGEHHPLAFDVPAEPALPPVSDASAFLGVTLTAAQRETLEASARTPEVDLAAVDREFDAEPELAAVLATRSSKSTHTRSLSQ